MGWVKCEKSKTNKNYNNKKDTMLGHEVVFTWLFLPFPLCCCLPVFREVDFGHDLFIRTTEEALVSHCTELDALTFY